MAERNGYSDFMAAEFIDRGHNADYRALFEEHRRQEQRSLASHKNQLAGFAQNREMSQARYAQRMKSIEDRRDRIADRIYKQHNSPLGRLQGMTRAGREKQREQIDRLDERMVQVQGRATRQFNSLTERQERNLQHERLHRAQQMRHIREDHQTARQAQQRTNEQQRPRLIEDRKQAMWQQAEQQLKQELRQDQRRAHTR